jgi:hypothetical protein
MRMGAGELPMSAETFLLLLVGIVAVFCLQMVANKARRHAEIPLTVLVGDEHTEVLRGSNLLLTEASLIRYRRSKDLLPRLFGVPQLLDVPESGAATFEQDAGEYRFCDRHSEPPGGAVFAFLARCCVRARQELDVSQMRPLHVMLVFTMSDPELRAKLARHVEPARFRALGVRLEVSERVAS